MSNPDPDYFKQLDPKSQMVVVLNSLEGNLLNFEDGITSKEHFVSRMRSVLLDLKMLLPHVNDKW